MVWGALLGAVMHPRMPDSLLPPIINDILDAASKGIANENAEFIFPNRFMSLVDLLSQPPLSPTDRVVLRTFTAHSTWSHFRTMNEPPVRRFVRVAESVPPSEGDSNERLDLSRLLEEFGSLQREARRSYEPQSGNSIIQEASQEETVLDEQSPAVAVDGAQMV